MAEALRCTQCGASLPTTLPIPKLDALLAAPEQLDQLAELLAQR